MSDPLHTRTVVREDYTDRQGNKKTRYKVTYARSPEAEAAMEQLRLGVFADIAPIDDPDYDHRIGDQQQVIVITPYATAMQAIATNVRKEKTPYKVMTGVDILALYLDRPENGQDTSLREGFTQFPHLYLLLGFMEAPNNYLSSLIVQLIGQRYHTHNHVWLFMPTDLTLTHHQWGDALKNLTYIPKERLSLTTDQTHPAGPSVQPKAKLPKSDYGQGDSQSQTPNQKDATSDRKFTKDPKKRKPK